jgi:Flp pilus assembly protein TadG
MFAKFSQGAERFRRDTEGAVVIIFALVLSVLVLLIGCAVDYARALHAGQKIANAIDAAAIAAARAMKDGSTIAQAKQLATDFYNENMKGSGNYAQLKKPMEIDVNPNTATVKIDVDAHVETAFTRVVGINWIAVPRAATAVYAIRDIEVGMALDVTGSMDWTVGGKRKIDSLKSAVEKFAILMIPETPVAGQKVRVGLAPYSSSVNVGSFAAAVSNNKSTDGCVVERKGAYSDTAVGAGTFFEPRLNSLVDMDPFEGLSASRCPNARLVPLTDNRTDIINTVKAFGTPTGSTAGHMGAQWAWNLVSPEWAGTWGGNAQPDPYSRVTDGKLVKAVIYMTDGIFNTAYNNGLPNDQAIALCDAMKAKGVLVFSITFNAPSSAKAVMQACASPGSEYFADAADEADLDAAFASFAATIKSLRLTQ